MSLTSFKPGTVADLMHCDIKEGRCFLFRKRICPPTPWHNVTKILEILISLLLALCPHDAEVMATCLKMT